MLPVPIPVKVAVQATLPPDADAVAVLLTDARPPAGLPRRVAAAVTALADAGVVTGKAGEAVFQLIEGHTPARLLVVGIGDPTRPAGENAWRVAGATLARVAERHGIRSLAVPAVADTAALASGFVLGRFSFTEYKTAADRQPAPVQLTLVGSAQVAAAVDRAVVVAEAQNLARAIASRPGNDVNPPSLAALAAEVAAAHDLRLTILDERAMADLGMGGFLGVGAGSRTPPRLIVLEHDGAGDVAPPLLVVGKAITFDSGGLSLKPAAKLPNMAYDKCGGTTVLGLMAALARLRVPRRVIGLLAAAENHISGSAYRPGDILRLCNGVTVEITSTDAEGRLVLADALAWGIRTYRPSAVVDVATLTGAVVAALGTTTAGLMANSDDLAGQLARAADRAGERLWRLPVNDEHHDRIRSSDPADLVNSAGPEAAALTAAAFLSHFVPADGSVAWAHLDIAGVARTDKPTPVYARGATGWGVRTLLEWAAARPVD